MSTALSTPPALPVRGTERMLRLVPPAAEAANPAAAAEEVPLFAVTRGTPTDEELAALTAVVLALQADTAEEAPRNRRRTSRRRELLRPFRPHGPGAWRHTFR